MSTPSTDHRARALTPLVVGALAGEAGARDLAHEVTALMHRYAGEFVAAHRLCPFLDDVTSGLGAVCVVLDRSLDVALARATVRATGSRVVHVIYPCYTGDSPVFERFGNDVAARLRADGQQPLVHAVFHPGMTGGIESPDRLARLVRRSPDPFLQFIPDGIQQGGTSYIDAPLPPPSALEQTFSRLTPPTVARLTDLQTELRSDRQRRYAPYESVFGPFG